MIIQFILTAGVCICLLYAFNRSSRTVLPEWSNWLAVWVGVSRGADLMFYIWIVISMFVILNLHIRNRVVDRKLTAIVRELALIKPQRLN